MLKLILFFGLTTTEAAFTRTAERDRDHSAAGFVQISSFKFIRRGENKADGNSCALEEDLRAVIDNTTLPPKIRVFALVTFYKVFRRSYFAGVPKNFIEDRLKEELRAIADGKGSGEIRAAATLLLIKFSKLSV